jgi:hypothetical protein
VSNELERLHDLLARVQRNAAAPRSRAGAAPPPPVEPESWAMAAADAPVEETTMVRAIEEHAEIEVDDVVVEISEPVEELELLEEEIVDITDVGAVSTTEVLLEEEEELPASSRRPIAASMTEALAGAAESVEMDDGREIPLKTPPPESGPQAAPPQGLAPPPVPEIEEIADADIVSGAQPTAAQLGATVDLEPGEPADLELGTPVREAPPAHLVREEAPASDVRPDVVQRPRVMATAPAGAFVTAAREFQPETFVELLDASLGLG